LSHALRRIPAARRPADGVDEGQHVVEVALFEIRQGVVAAFEQFDPAFRIAVGHFTPVEHFVALGDDGEDLVGPRQGADVERAQLPDVFGPEMEMLRGVVPERLVADLANQVAVRVDRGVQQHRSAVGRAGDISGIEPAQGGPDDRHRASRPVGDAPHHEVDGLPWRRRQLGAPPSQVGVLARDALGHERRLGRAGRGAKAMQVEQVGGSRHGAHYRDFGRNCVRSLSRVRGER